MKNLLKKMSDDSKNRFDFWKSFIDHHEIENMLEVGVFQGSFSEHILKNCNSINKYTMIDPWKHLNNWNKPANVTDQRFETIYNEAMDKTNFAEKKRIVLRGETKEVIDQIPDNSLDFAYIDGDHTLRGITIDLIKVYPKIKNNGWIGGDDLCENIFQHGANYEPTLIFPFALYFAESMNDVFIAIKHDQFLIKKTNDNVFDFINLVNEKYNMDNKKWFEPIKKITI